MSVSYTDENRGFKGNSATVAILAMWVTGGFLCCFNFDFGFSYVR